MFREVMSVTGIEGGLAANVDPRSRALPRSTTGTRRTARPPKPRSACAISSVGRCTLHGTSPPARVVTDTPLVRRLREAGEFELEPKQAWTPVAEFSAHGLDAVNLGPGATRYAHTATSRSRSRSSCARSGALQAFASA